MLDIRSAELLGAEVRRTALFIPEREFYLFKCYPNLQAKIL